MMKTAYFAATAAATLFTLMPTAQAEPFSMYEKVNPQVPAGYNDDSSTGPDLDLVLGVGIGYAPEYKGSDDYEAIVLPIVDARYQDMFFLTHRDGLGATFVNVGNFAGGVSFLPDFGRDQGDNGRLNGLGDIDGTVEGGIFAGYYEDVFSIEGRMHQDMIDGHDGMTAQLRAGVHHAFSPQLYGALDAYLDYGSEDYMQSYFGVSGTQSTNSGLAAFAVDSGFNEGSIAANVTYMLTPGWFVNGTAAYSTLMGDADDSPISEDDGQFLLSVQSGYRF